jgi:hypothetical protein
MAEYQLTATDATVVRTADQAYIPNDPANRDWQEYQAWLAAGGVPDPYVPPPEPEPKPDQDHGETANLRIAAGVNQAMDAYNQYTPAPWGGQGELSVDERLLRLEESFKAMCNGQILTEPKPKWADDGRD